ncbi:MAG: helix-turn-helix transcriptional regulator [Clostridia bacterium]|nr:helix-turn-helix transcriptional regulator [Clostridia bacterium]
MAFNKNLKNLRKQAGITQDALANACCVHYQTVSKWERGNLPFSIL